MVRRTGLMFALAVLVGIALVTEASRLGWFSWPHNGSPDNEPSPGETGDEPRAPDDTYRQSLITAGWTERAADAVVRLNHEWFLVLQTEHPVALASQLKLLENLGSHPRLGPFLAKHPETAGLLPGAHDPELIMRSLDGDDKNYECLASLYVQHAAANDAAELARALEKNRDLICSLYDRGLLGCEAMFLFDRGDQADEEYER